MYVRVIQRVKSVQVTVVLSSWLSLRGGPNHKFLVDFCVNYSTERTCTSGKVTEGDSAGVGVLNLPVASKTEQEILGALYMHPITSHESPGC